MPCWARAYEDAVTSALGHPRRLKNVLQRSTVPMVLVDRDRRHVDVNVAARLVFRLCLTEMRRLRIDDLTAPEFVPAMQEAWRRLLATGRLVGPHQALSPDGSPFSVTYYALAHALPELHLVAFAPAEWPDEELVDAGADHDPELAAALTPRELEVLDLAAAGCNGPMIAARLVLSAATVRTHFEHIYHKLKVSDRAAAVAKAMRMGLIA